MTGEPDDILKATVIVCGAIEAGRLAAIDNEDMAAALLRGFIEMVMASPNPHTASDALLKVVDALRGFEYPKARH
jgi:hypothetical protein